MAFTTKPKGDHATFDTDCVKCLGLLAINNGWIDSHDCRPPSKPTTLDDLQFPEPTE